MRGEPVGRHPRGVRRVILVLDEPGLDHPPANRALRRSEAEERRQARRERARDPPLGGEVRQGQDEVPAQRAAPLPVSPLHPVYELEVVHGHPRVRLLVLWGLLVLGELRVPVLGGERRFLDEFPVGHGQAAPSEPGDAAQDDHAVHPRAPSREPPPERSFRGGSSVHQRTRRDGRDGRRRRGGGERAARGGGQRRGRRSRRRCLRRRCRVRAPRRVSRAGDRIDPPRDRRRSRRLEGSDVRDDVSRA